MSDFKYTKNELTSQKSKLDQLNKYLPSLKLKKVLLQTQVNQAEEQIREQTKVYDTYLIKMSAFSRVYSDWHANTLEESVEIKERVLHYENIAGIEVPYLINLKFNNSDRLIYADPVWTQSAILHLRQLKEHYERLMVSKQRKLILQRELRVVSIRINLFEKRLIPNIEDIVNKIKVFLQDQELQTIGQAKVAKAKLSRKGCYV